MSSGLFCLGTLYGQTGTAAAQEVAPGEVASGDAWRYSMELFGFLPWSITADIAVREQMTTIDADASDVVDKLQAGGAGRFEAWRDRFGVIVEGGYLQIGEDREVGAATPVAASVRRLSGDLMLGVVAARFGAHPSPRAMIELSAGARLEFLDGRLRIGDVQTEHKDDHIKGVGAVHVPVHVTERVSLHGRGTLAARHGTQWTFLGYAEYDFGSVALSAGYRYDSVKSEGESLAVDCRAHNVYAAFTLRFGAEG